MAPPLIPPDESDFVAAAECVGTEELAACDWGIKCEELARGEDVVAARVGVVSGELVVVGVAVLAILDSLRVGEGVRLGVLVCSIGV